MALGVGWHQGFSSLAFYEAVWKCPKHRKGQLEFLIHGHVFTESRTKGQPGKHSNALLRGQVPGVYL